MTEIDEGALRQFLADRIPGDPPEELSVESLGGGNANRTLLVPWTDGDLVLRLPPLDEPAPEILHGLPREYRVLEALEKTWVPTPKVHCRCGDETVLGDPFYVMEHLEGEIPDVALPTAFDSPQPRWQVGAETLDTLAKIHHLDVDRLDLADLAAPDPSALVEQFSQQLEWSQERTADERELPRLWAVHDWLVENAPPAEDCTLTHGDFKPDNLLFAPGLPPRIEGVLDWELVGRGDPRGDLGWLLSYWSSPADPSPLTDDLRERYKDHPYFPLLEVFVDDYSEFMAADGFHSRADLVRRYEVQTGLEYRHDRFYRAFAAFKLAALCDGFFRVYLEGSASSKETYPAMEMLVPTLARQAKQVIDGERGLGAPTD